MAAAAAIAESRTERSRCAEQRDGKMSKNRKGTVTVIRR